MRVGPDQRSWITQSLGRIGKGAIPQLLGMLKSDDASVRIAAIHGMQVNPDPLHVAPLRAALLDSNSSVRRWALSLLQTLDPEIDAKEPAVVMKLALEDLARYMARPSSATSGGWSHAIRSLGATGDLRVVPRLLDVLDKVEDPICQEVAEAIAKIGPRVVPMLSKSLHSESTRQREWAVVALGLMLPATREKISELLASSDPAIAGHARSVLRRPVHPVRRLRRHVVTGVAVEVPPEDPVLLWFSRLASPDRKVRARANQHEFRVVGLPDSRVVFSAIEHREEAVRLGALIASRNRVIYREGLLPLFVHRLSDTASIRAEAAQRLNSLYKPLPQFSRQFADALLTSSSATRLLLLQLLVRLGPKGSPSLENCLHLLRDGVVEVSVKACRNIRMMGILNPDVRRALLEATRHRVADVRAGALHALITLGAPTIGIEDDMLALLDDESAAVRTSAARFLCRTRAQKAWILERLDSLPQRHRALLLANLFTAVAGALTPHERGRLAVERRNRQLRGLGKRQESAKPIEERLSRSLLEEMIRNGQAGVRQAAFQSWLRLELPYDQGRAVIVAALDDQELCFQATEWLVMAKSGLVTEALLRKVAGLKQSRGEPYLHSLIGIDPIGVRLAVEYMTVGEGDLSQRFLFERMSMGSIPTLLDIAVKGPVSQRVTAIKALGLVGMNTHENPLQRSFHDPDTRERDREIFRHMKSVIPAFVTFLDDEDPRIISATSESLRSIGSAAHAALSSRLFHPRRQERVRAFLLLPSRLPFPMPRAAATPRLPEASVTVLTAGLKDPLPYFQARAMSMLSVVANKHPKAPDENPIRAAISQLMVIAADRESPVRVRAIETLRSAGLDAMPAVPLLIELVGEWERSGVATAAMNALSVMKPAADRIVPVLWRELRRRHPNGDPVYQAACSLGPKALPIVHYGLRRGWYNKGSIGRMGLGAISLIHLLHDAPASDDDYLARLMALCVPRMSEQQKMRVIGAFERRVQDNPRKHIQVAKVLRSLGALPVVDVEPYLARRGQDPNHQAIHALEHLSVLGAAAKSATDPLIAIIEAGGSDAGIAAESLGRIYTDSDEEGTERVLDVLRAASKTITASDQRTRICRGMVHVGRRALPVVTELVLDRGASGAADLSLAMHALLSKHPDWGVDVLEKNPDGFGLHRRSVLSAMARGVSAPEHAEALVERVIKLFDLEPKTKIEGLGNVGLPAVPHLIKYLDGGSQRETLSALSQLGKIGPPVGDSIPELLKRAGQNESLRLPIARVLVTCGPRGAVACEDLTLNVAEWQEVLKKIEYRPNPWDQGPRARGYIRTLATVAMTHGTEVFMPKGGRDRLRLRGKGLPFIAYVKSHDRVVRRWAEIGMATVIAKPEMFMEPLADANTDVRRAAARQVHKYASPALVEKWLATLILSLEDDDAVVRAEIAGCLGMMGTGARVAIPALKDHLKDPEAEVRAAVAEAIKVLGSK